MERGWATSGPAVLEYVVERKRLQLHCRRAGRRSARVRRLVRADSQAATTGTRTPLQPAPSELTALLRRATSLPHRHGEAQDRERKSDRAYKEKPANNGGSSQRAFPHRRLS